MSVLSGGDLRMQIFGSYPGRRAQESGILMSTQNLGSSSLDSGMTSRAFLRLSAPFNFPGCAQSPS